jgi:ethanolamine transporter
MSATPGWWTLARAIVWSELRGRGWRLFTFPVGAGLLFLGLLGATAVSPDVLTGTTREALAAQAGQYFTGMDSDTALLLAMLVIQGPYFIAMTGAVLSVLVTQTGVGQRLAAGELELLLSGPYREREVFVALVAGSFALSLLMIGVLLAMALGGSALILAWADVSLTTDAVRLLGTGLLTPIPLALWTTFLAVVVYLRFPDTPVNGTEPGNLLILAGILPAVSLIVLPTAVPSVDPFLLSVSGIGVSLAAVGVGWVSVRRWLDVKTLL